MVEIFEFGSVQLQNHQGEQQEDRTRRPRTETESATVEGDGLESLIPNWPVNGRALLEFSDRGYWEWKGSL